MNPTPRATRGAVGGMIVLTIAAYLPSLWNGYVWDDVPLIVQNRLFNAPFDLQTALTTDLWAGAAIGDEAASGYFRPLMVLSLWVDQALGGHPAVAHAHNLVWHIAAVLLAAGLGVRSFGRSAGVGGALVLALHPVQSEAVLWVAARNDLMATTFALGALLLTTGPRAWPVAAACATVLAGLSKESVVLLPLLGGLVLWPQLPRLGWRGWAGRLVPIGVGVVGVGGLRLLAGVAAARAPSAAGAQLVVESSPHLLGWLGWKLAMPWPLSTGYALEYLDRLPATGLVLGGLVVLGGTVALIRRGGQVGRIGLAWTFLGLAPVGWALATTGWMGERYLYLPVLGLGWALGGQLDIRAPIHLRGGIAIALVWAAIVGVRTADWRSDRDLWASAWAATPSPFTAESLGHAVRGADGPDAALEWFVRTLDDPEPLQTACGPAVRSAVAAQKMVLAAQIAAWATERGCAGPSFVGWRAITLAGTGRWDLLREWVAAPIQDPDGRLDIARAALALHDGDDLTVAALEKRWTGERALVPQAQALVDNAQRHAPVVEP